MTDCPPADQLLGFVAGTLSDDAAAFIETHIDTCEPCRTSLSSLASRDVASSGFGRYRLETVLGTGGMGIVYRAWDPQLARPLAIKVVKQAAEDESNRARLVREAQSLARLSHPNVCHVYDVGTEGDEVWVAMELIDGTTLRQWAHEHTSFAEQHRVLLAAAEGIAAAHAAGIVHRDVKPENVLVTREGRAIVTDFGLARVDQPVDPIGSTQAGSARDPMMTATGAVVGTPAYLAPEQLTGAPIDARVDQFAWAVMAWELLTGMRPFPIIAGARLDAVRAGLVPPRSLPRPLALALIRAMAMAPRERFPSMRELIAAIGTPARQRSRRTPMLIAGSAVLLAGAGFVAIQATRSSDDTRVAASDERAEDRHGLVVSPGPTAPVDALATAPVIAPVDALVVTALPDAGAVLAARADPAHATAPIPSAKAATTKLGAGAIAPSPPAVGATRAQADDEQFKGTGAVYVERAQKFSRNGAIGTIDAFCGIPVDPLHPDPAIRKPVIDWGKVTRREIVIAKLGEREERMPMYEVAGQRATYRFDGDEWNSSIGQFFARVGDLVVVCPEDVSDMYTLPPSWKGGMTVMRAMLPVSAPPVITKLAALDPIHVYDLAIVRDATSGKTRLDPNRNYLVHAKIGTAEGGTRWYMDRFWIDVPAGIPGANLMAEGKSLWFVLDTPVFEDQADGTKPRFVLHAKQVLDVMFPE